ncbi:MAG: FGGY family carbohydrate kinase, partial [Candidatus Hodarchaeales archaeon]
GRGLPFLFPLARLLWFQENEEEIYEKIKHMLTIDGWISYRLTGNYTIDDTSASETLLFDIKKRTWSDKILEEFNVPQEILPKLLTFGEHIGDILPEVSQELGIKAQTPVFIACADTPASLVGCGAITSGSLGIVAGSTMPIYFVCDKPFIDPEHKIWTNPFVGNQWVIESNAGSTGEVYQWFIDSFLTKLGVKNPHTKFEDLIGSQAPGAGGVFANLGTQVFNTQNMLQIPNGGFTFTPIVYMMDGIIDVSSFALATMENFSYAIRANAEQIQNLSKFTPKDISVVGGLSRSKSFCQVIANVLQSEVRVFEAEGAILGCFIACMVGTNKYNTVREAVSRLITDYRIFEPNESYNEKYAVLYSQWREIYQKSREDT